MASSPTEPARLERNLVLYGRFAVLNGTMFWLPVFFLFFARHFDVGQIFLLQSFYYLSVVVLEVPSGYFSDRVGRVATLRIAGAAFVASFAVFVLAGDTIWPYLVAQALLAAGFSFTSGTTASFHYDNLEALGRTEEFDEREARLNRNRFLATAVAVLAGGVLGLIDLRLPYLASLVAMVALAVQTIPMVEPHRAGDDAAEEAFSDQLRRTIGYLRIPLLGWIGAYVILQLTLEHLPHVFAQPYLAAALGEPLDDVRTTPVLIALFVALSSLVGAGAAAVSIRLRDRFGLFAVLLGLAALQTAIVAAMGLGFHPLIAALVSFRGAQPAGATVLVNVTATPLVGAGQRATFLSLTSLAGRLGYAGVLFAIGTAAGALTVDKIEQLRISIWLGTAIAVIGLAAVAFAARPLAERTNDETAASNPAT